MNHSAPKPATGPHMPTLNGVGDFRLPNTAEMAASYGGAEEAFAQGNYELAAMLAAREDDDELAASAIILCGGLHQGLDKLEKCEWRRPDTAFAAAYAHWCLGDIDQARDVLTDAPTVDGDTRDRLLSAMARTSYTVTVIADDNNTRGAPLGPGPGFTIHHLCTEDFQVRRDEALARIAESDLIYTFDPLDEEILRAADRAGVPVVSVCGDLDQAFVGWDDTYAASALILGGMTFDHYFLAALYKARVACFSGLTFRENRGEPVTCDGPRPVDLFFSGKAFAPHWADKARFLFRLATFDDPDLNIHVVQGYLDQASYRKAVVGSKYVVLYNRTGYSVSHDRGIEVLTYGGNGLAADGIPAHYILGDAGRRVAQISWDQLDADLQHLLAAEAPGALEADAEILEDFYAPPPLRDRRALLFCLYQFVLGTEERADMLERQRKRADPVRHKAVFDFLKQPLDEAKQQRVCDLYDSLRERAADDILERFNYGCLLWLMGKRAAAVEAFAAVLAQEAEGRLDPVSSIQLPHLVQSFSELMPFQSFHKGLLLDESACDKMYPHVRHVVGATARTYLALDHLQNDRIGAACDLLQEALRSCPEHHPAARLLTKALYAGGAEPAAIAKAFLMVADLYPPDMGEVLPYGIAALEKLGALELAQEYARKWAYFMTRVSWIDTNGLKLTQDTVNTVNRYAWQFPAALQLRLKEMQKGSPSTVDRLFSGRPVVQHPFVAANGLDVIRDALKTDQPYFGDSAVGAQSSSQQYGHLAALVKAVASRRGDRLLRVLEIGSWIGGSAITWAKAIKAYHPAAGQVTCVDPWLPYRADHAVQNDGEKSMNEILESDLAFELFRHNVRTTGVENLIETRRGTSAEAMPHLEPESFDIIYIDGDHDYDAVRFDLHAAASKLKVGGILCGDDLEKQAHEVDRKELRYAVANKLEYVKDTPTGQAYHPGVTLAVSEFAPKVHVKDGIWFLRKTKTGWEPFGFPSANTPADVLPANLAWT